LFVTIHHDRGSRSSTSATTCVSTCVNNLKVSNYSCRIHATTGILTHGSASDSDPAAQPAPSFHNIHGSQIIDYVFIKSVGFHAAETRRAPERIT
jgi:hypothetical protein